MLGVPGKLTPYTFMDGVVICISYQIDGNDNSRCGSLQRMGAPLFVFLPLTTQLLLPLLGSCLLYSFTAIVSLLPKYSESAVAGFIGTIPAESKTVPLGMMGTR